MFKDMLNESTTDIVMNGILEGCVIVVTCFCIDKVGDVITNKVESRKTKKMAKEIEDLDKIEENK